ncbi:hypothetical protein [Aureliella helgolandensis]|uniref:Uncharacterized protein n=1 Tax=Aureliella helgolandensis TaxID=2527968 RepID=A0A518G0E4_9BACT|nr:hypothetical protein [Aureliella helgolandensis]QDV22078.1 hypothetical protein Q31a_03570 [Aureliella helgolandensis]
MATFQSLRVSNGSPLLSTHQNIIQIAFGAHIEIGLADAVDSKEFVIDDWAESESTAKFVLHRKREIGKHHFDKLFVELDPKNAYRVVEAGLAMNDQNGGLPISKLVYEYDNAKTADVWRIIPKRCSLKTVDDGQTVFKYQFNKLSKEKLPIEEFTLAHYGLPEYEGDRTSPMIWYVAVGTGIGLAALLAINLRKKWQ